MRWICCQLGAREHYAVPRALHRRQLLERLITDLWVPPNHPLGFVNPRLRERFHPELPSGLVACANSSSLAFETGRRLAGRRGWQLIVDRNKWFQNMAARRIQKLDGAEQRVVFAYSYAAKEIFRKARERGWQTVLGQIDPGPGEERLVEQVYLQYPELGGEWKPIPADYWENWRQECELADHIVVNSNWSRRLLLEEGIPEAKVKVIPLAYDVPDGAANFERTVPDHFSAQRPLRVLFLGQINLRKGVGSLLEAIRLLKGEPMEFWFVGPLQISVPPDLKCDPGVRWLGPVSRGDAAKYYRDADVFILPSLSDGFGLTQLEAQAWLLPVIASRSCGEVVAHDVNGILLDSPSPATIAKSLRRCMTDPTLLNQLSRGSKTKTHGLDELGQTLVDATNVLRPKD